MRFVCVTISEQVNIRVGDGRKEKWNDHATDDFGEKYGTISKLIWHAVERQIEQNKGGSETGAQQTQPVEANGQIDDILTGVEDNGNALDSKQDCIDRLYKQVAAGGDK